MCNDVPSFFFHETIKGFNVNVKVFTLNRNLDVVEFVVPSRVEAAEVGIDKADPKCRSHFSNQTPGSTSSEIVCRKSTSLE